MIKFLYIVYGVVVVIVSTITNLAYMGDSSSTSRSWSSHSSGVSYGGSGSTGGFSSGGGHK